jgi:hypothetical protein
MRETMKQSNLFEYVQCSVHKHGTLYSVRVFSGQVKLECVKCDSDYKQTYMDRWGN